MADGTQDSQITTESLATTSAGVPDGIVEKNNPELHEAIRDRIEHTEKVVIEANGSFHKEAVTGEQA